MKTTHFYNKITTSCAFLITLFAFFGSSIAQQEKLLPDQNPNYKRSMEKYMSNHEELLKYQGTTIQATYKAIDDVQLKKERKDLRRTYRQERRLARINNRGYYYSSPFYNNYGYGYNYYNNYSISPYRSYNNYYNPYSNYRPYSASCGLNIGLPLLGLGLYWGSR